ncbi:helix-turn-helix transcriptional regulator [Mycolicibacterium boenickei]|nr:helix-turn-helix transcriptional regulator [Mycolicibacterium boenickei]
MSDPFEPADLTADEQHAIALARAELKMLKDLVELRHHSGLTQQDVADAIGRDKSAVSRFERLDSDPRLSTVRRYARAVGAMVTHSVTDFVQRTPQESDSASVSAGNFSSSEVEQVMAEIIRFRSRRAIPRTQADRQKRLVAVGT